MKNILKIAIVFAIGISTTFAQTTKSITTTTTTTTIIEEPIPIEQSPDFVITYGNTVYSSYDYTITNINSNIITVQAIKSPSTIVVLKAPSVTDFYIVESSPSFINFKFYWGGFWKVHPHIHHYNRWSVYSKSPRYSNTVRQAVRQSNRQVTRNTTRKVKRKADRRQDERQDNRSSYSKNTRNNNTENDRKNNSRYSKTKK